MVVIVNTK